MFIIRCLSLESELGKANSDVTRLQVLVTEKDDEILVREPSERLRWPSGGCGDAAINMTSYLNRP